MRHIKLLSLALFGALSSAAQNHYYSGYSWEKEPVVFKPTGDALKSDLILVSDRRIHETAYDPDGQAVVYETVHLIYHVNSQKAVDEVNKGYMASRNILEEIDLKARCINASNKVIHFNKSTLKSVDNLEGSGAYKIFAIDGVEPGCDVEILYTNKKQFTLYSYFFVQTGMPTINLERRIISPKNLVFETRSYNGLPEFRSDTSDKNKNHLFLIADNIPAVREEKYSSNRAHNMAYMFQLSYNTDRQKSRIYTWDIISRELYSGIYHPEKNEQKAIAKAVSKSKTSGIKNEGERLRAFDSWFKTNFEIGEHLENLPFEKAVELKKVDETNGMKFYVNALKELEIPFELVVSAKKDDVKFDSKYPSYIFMKEFLVYFPNLNKFVSPMSAYSRPGYPDYDLIGNDGLFINEVNIGDIKTSTSGVKTIPVNDYKDSYHNTDVVAKLDFSNNSVKLDVTHSIFGYSAFYVQPIYRYLSAQQKEDINRNYELSENSAGVKNFTVGGIEEKDVLTKPMVVKFNSDQNDFLENAGNKYIFKAGLLIGPQAELYQEDNRRTPALMYFAHFLKRELQIEFPEGYRPTNMKDIEIEKKCMIGGKESAIFKSTCELKGNKVVISVYEDYRDAEYALADFEALKSVINAAADFNKKKLIFEKL